MALVSVELDEPASEQHRPRAALHNLQRLLAAASAELEDTYGPISPPPSIRRLELLLHDAATQLEDSVDHAEAEDRLDEAAEADGDDASKLVQTGGSARVGAQALTLSAMEQISTLLLKRRAEAAEPKITEALPLGWRAPDEPTHTEAPLPLGWTPSDKPPAPPTPPPALPVGWRPPDELWAEEESSPFQQKLALRRQSSDIFVPKKRQQSAPPTHVIRLALAARVRGGLARHRLVAASITPVAPPRVIRIGLSPNVRPEADRYGVARGGLVRLSIAAGGVHDLQPARLPPKLPLHAVHHLESDEVAENPRQQIEPVESARGGERTLSVRREPWPGWQWGFAACCGARDGKQSRAKPALASRAGGHGAFGTPLLMGMLQRYFAEQMQRRASATGADSGDTYEHAFSRDY